MSLFPKHDDQSFRGWKLTLTPATASHLQCYPRSWVGCKESNYVTQTVAFCCICGTQVTALCLNCWNQDQLWKNRSWMDECVDGFVDDFMGSWVDGWWVKPTYSSSCKWTQFRNIRALKFGKARARRVYWRGSLSTFPKLPVNMSPKDVQFRYSSNISHYHEKTLAWFPYWVRKLPQVALVLSTYKSSWHD